MAEIQSGTGTLPAAQVAEIMASDDPSDESETEIVGETSASYDIPKNDTTGELRKSSMTSHSCIVY
jgi:hypothetical protein